MGTKTKHQPSKEEIRIALSSYRTQDRIDPEMWLDLRRIARTPGSSIYQEIKRITKKPKGF